MPIRSVPPKPRFLLDPLEQFHDAFGIKPAIELRDSVERERLYFLRAKLLLEETLEAVEALGYSVRDANLYRSNSRQPLVDLAKELADVLVVTAGTAEVLEIPLEECFTEVMRSNMSKLNDNGRPIYREDGKVLKGPKYTPPDLSALME